MLQFRMVLRVLAAFVVFMSSVSAKTTLEWWQFWTDPDIRPVLDQIVADFEKANPDIEVKLTDLTWSDGHEKIVIALSSGKGPDVLELGSDWLAQFAANEQLVDISRDIADDSSEYDGWSMATWRGRVYAFPWLLGTRVLFGNREVLAKAGVNNPDWVPQNFTDLIIAARMVTRLDGLYGWGSNAPEKHRLYKKFLPFFWSYGAQVLTDDGKHCVVSSTKAIQAMNTYRLFHDSTGFVGTQRQIEDAFLDGKIAFILSGDWLLKRIRKEGRKIDLAAYLFPGPRLPGKSFMGGEFLAINAASRHKKEALRFIRFLASPQNQLALCKAGASSNPSSRRAQRDPWFTADPIRDIFVRQLRASKHPPVDPDWVYMEAEIERAVERVVFERELPGVALRDAQIAITRIRAQRQSQ